MYFIWMCHGSVRQIRSQCHAGFFSLVTSMHQNQRNKKNSSPLVIDLTANPECVLVYSYIHHTYESLVYKNKRQHKSYVSDILK